MISPALQVYFADLLANNANLSSIPEEEDEDDDDDRKPQSRQHQLPTIVFDNARLPSPLLGQVGEEGHDDLMGCGSEVSCHTRSTISTCASSLSASSAHSAGSVSSTGSSSRWDSNPSHKPTTKVDSSIKRPQRPGRSSSDDAKHRTTNKSSTIIVDIASNNNTSAATDKGLKRPSRSNSSSSSNSSSRRSSIPPPTKGNSRHDRPKRPTRTSSNTTKSKSQPQQPSNPHKQSSSLDKKITLSQANSGSSSSRSHSKKGAGENDSSSSETSLKDIFRTASHHRRAAAVSTANAEGGRAIARTSSNSSVVLNQPMPGARNSPTRTVNEILGQSMDELQMMW